MIFKKRYVLGLAITMGLIFMGIESFDNSQSNLDDIAKVEKVYEIKENKNGQTYGSELSSTEYDNGPDLISFEMKNGEVGYVYRDEFYDSANQPNNPEEAMEYMDMVERNIKKYGYYKLIPVYEEDGKTEIGSFEIGGN
ncbi:hypothetical protein HF520_01120 [Romboutsia sp. CE17]|uniref:hypothetical protein n=1 Tax=Romboutsia sp. CE17 TaxID=2724150 RepID=UPI001442C9D4|nr:hypothetical protein [Romboutsia sp. CE17]QJA07629.1 hypothetical protein HF520_01120 [Romboutsia sp. CE17]